MLLTITNTKSDARDLGWLLHKHPDRLQSFRLPFGEAKVFYPQAEATTCTAALLLEVDPVALVKSKSPGGRGGSFDHYVNDRPYVASSLMSVAMARVFGTAMKGRCPARPELESQPLPLEAKLAVLPSREGATMIHRLFEPLGYTVTTEEHALDEQFPAWPLSPYYTVWLSAERPLHELLNHLYILIPVLDDQKHYWISQDEVEKLLASGESWLGQHPERETITRRYLRHLRPLTRDALSRLAADDIPDPDAAVEAQEQEEEAVEQPLKLNEQRYATVLSVLQEAAVDSVLDLGCADGKLLGRLLEVKQFRRIVGVDVALGALERSKERLQLDRLPEFQRQRIQLWHGSLMYRDERLGGFDAACLIEVIEHLDEARLRGLERSVFEFARPGMVIITTPNREYNVRFENLPAGSMRHRDHRFEWTRGEFQEWAEDVGARYGYDVRYLPIGAEDQAVGPPTQMGVFERRQS